MEKVRNGEIPMGKVQNGKTLMEKFGWKTEKVQWKKSGPAGKKSCVAIFRWKKSESRKKSENGPYVYSNFLKFYAEFNPQIFSPF